MARCDDTIVGYGWLLLGAAVSLPSNKLTHLMRQEFELMRRTWEVLRLHCARLNLIHTVGRVIFTVYSGAFFNKYRIARQLEFLMH